MSPRGVPLAALWSCALLPLALGRTVAPKLAASLKSQGDASVVSVACCGSGSSVLQEALGVSGKDVCVVAAPTPLVLTAAHKASEAAAVLSASDVLAAEINFYDLVRRSPRGLAQLVPLLHRAMRLRHIRPRKKLLLLIVTDFDASEASEADVTAFVDAELEAMAADVLDDGSTLSSVLQLKCMFIPYEQHEPDAYSEAVEAVCAAVTSSSSAGYIFPDGQWCAPASALASTLEQALSNGGSTPKLAAPPAEVHTAYQCGLLAEAAARDFNKGATSLRKASDAGLLADFGEKAGALIEGALERFDEESQAHEGSQSALSARAALQQQLSRSLYPSFRKQLAALQRKSLATFRQKLSALKPSAEIDAELKELVKEAGESFDAQAVALVPTGLKWSYAYEKQAVVDNIKENVSLHLHTLQSQGLYLPSEGIKLPLDISAHWLGLHPFGRDSRYDPVGVDDSPAFRPQAAPMSLRASSGYRPRTKRTDPSKMVFTDKMLQ